MEYHIYKNAPIYNQSILLFLGKNVSDHFFRIHIVFNSCTRNSSSPSEMTPGSGSPLENLPLKRPELWREPRSSLLSSLVLDDRFSLSIFLPVPLPIDSLIEKKTCYNHKKTNKQKTNNKKRKKKKGKESDSYTRHQIVRYTSQTRLQIVIQTITW